MERIISPSMFIVLLLECSSIEAQTVEPKVHNFQTFSPTVKDISAELERLTPTEFQSHPEYGELPYNSPCENCYELIHMRTDSTRMFVEKGSEGTKFYSQAAYGKIHYTDSDGFLRTYDPRIKKTTASPDLYTAVHQDFPLELNAETGHTKLHLPLGQQLIFNNQLSLIHVSDSGFVSNLGPANWSNYTAGSDGVKITDAWSDIDIEIKIGLGEIKTDYILKSNPGYDNGYLVIVDHLEADDDFVLQMDEIYETDNALGTSKGTVRYLNPDGDGILIGSAFGYDQSGDKSNAETFGYKINDSDLEIWIPVSWISDTNKIYPLIIDPLVTSSATYTAGIMRFRYNGSFCFGPNADCGYTLNVPRPPNSTLTGASFSLVQETLNGFCFGCWMSEAGWYFSTTCGLDGYWGCNLNNPGTCTGTNVDFSGLVTCLAPACAGTVAFNIFNSYCYCTTGGACGNSCQRINNNTWVVTITGSTVETLGNTATGNGSQTINDPDCIGTVLLDPTAQNGVPGYTYLWSTGATSSTITVPATPAVYTATVTDACGTAVVATFNVGCPLPVRLNSFTALLKDEKTYINWEILSDAGIAKIILERADVSGNFHPFKTLIPSANEKGNYYEEIDPAPYNGVTYYRLSIVSDDGVTEYSEVVSVFKENDGISVIPNPTSGLFTVTLNTLQEDEILFEVINSSGLIVYSEIIVTTENITKHPIDLSNESKGVYTIRIQSAGKVYSEKLIIR